MIFYEVCTIHGVKIRIKFNLYRGSNCIIFPSFEIRYNLMEHTIITMDKIIICLEILEKITLTSRNDLNKWRML